VWAAVGVAVIVVIVLARRSGTAAIPGTASTDASGSGSGSSSSDAIVAAKSQAFQAIAGLLGAQAAAKMQSDTTLGLASIQATIEAGRNSTALAVAQIQADAEARATQAALTGATLQTGAQVSAAQNQAKSQQGAQVLNFLNGIVNTAGQVITTVLNKGGNRPPVTGAKPGATIDPSLIRNNPLIGFGNNNVWTH
jgi:hypothetical protein